MMTLMDFVKKLKKIELHTRGCSREALAGSYLSAFKGRGMSFHDFKEYEAGDDVRSIDWRVSARSRTAYVRQYIEERELNVCIVLDLTATMRFASVGMSKAETAILAMAVLAFSAFENNDKVSLFVFGSEGLCYISPQKGKQKLYRFLHEAIHPHPRAPESDLTSVLGVLARVLKRQSVVFIVSDFVEAGYEMELLRLAHKHDLVPVVIYDPMEERMPDLGVMILEDPIRPLLFLADTGLVDLQNQLALGFAKRKAAQLRDFRRAKLEPIYLCTANDVVEPLVKAFIQRGCHV